MAQGNDKVMQVEKPILNSPFAEPLRYWKIERNKTPRLIEGERRPAKYYYRVPETGARRKRKDHDDISDLFEDRRAFYRNDDEHDYDFDVNDMRRRVAAWRISDYRGATQTTKDLLRHWASEERVQRLFFCQLEAAETIIFLKEAPKEFRSEMAPVPKDDLDGKLEINPFIRYACKMATGTGKTTVMGMLAAWSILNSVEAPRDRRFSDTILVVCPGVTIKNRLQELDPASGDGSIYWTRDLVPRAMRPRLAEGEVMIANWQKLDVKECNDVNGIKSKAVGRGVKTPAYDKKGVPTGGVKYMESDAAWMKRIRGEFSAGSKGRSPNWMVFNDEAHHAYRRGDAGTKKAKDYSTELDSHNERGATVWIEGLDRINRLLGGRGDGINMCVDLSATPFYLSCTGNDVGMPFPWVVSDFSLLDSIESGLVKIPQLPSKDSGPSIDDDGKAAYFNIWRYVQWRMKEEKLGKSMTPENVMNFAAAPITQLADDWEAKRKDWPKETPPVFIVVCENTKIAAELHNWISGGPTKGAYSPPPECFRNTEDELATIRVDTAAFKEIESGGGKDEGRILRFTMDTIGKEQWPGNRPPAEWESLVERQNTKAANDETGAAKPIGDASIPPGRDIKCIVSVGMLTEGWDANNVTHIIGLRPFGSQLLCEQVIGRALRRQSYAIGEDELLAEETATVYGVPFELVPFKSNLVKPVDTHRDINHLHTDDSKKEYRIQVPRVTGFVTDGMHEVEVAWDQVPEQDFEGMRKVEVKQLTVEDGRDLADGAGKTEEHDPDRIRRRFRKQQLAFMIALRVCNRYLDPEFNKDEDMISKHRLFGKVLPHAIRYLDEKVKIEEGQDLRDFAAEGHEMNTAVRALCNALRKGGGSMERARIPAKRDTYLTTDEVDYPTPKKLLPADKCHLNAMVIDSKLEGDAGKNLDMHPGVVKWVKNTDKGLGLRIPYWNHMDLRSEYEPDFVVVTDRGINVIVEMKGREDDFARIKAKAAERWVNAVNNHGGHGRWEYIMVQFLGDLRAGLDNLCELNHYDEAPRGD